MILSKKQLAFSLFTLAIYTVLLGWRFAIVITGTIAFHELCHLQAAKYLKLSTGGFTLLPLIGGVSFITERYKTNLQRVIVVIAGPIGGSLLGFIVGGIGLLTHQHFLIWAGYWNLLVNIFNLVPLGNIVDGGQLLTTMTISINKTISMICNVVSTAAGSILLFWWNPIIGCLIAYFGGQAAYREYLNWKSYREGKFHLCSNDYLYPPTALTTKQMILTGIVWISSAAIMGYYMVMLHNYL